LIECITEQYYATRVIRHLYVIETEEQQLHIQYQLINRSCGGWLVSMLL